MRLAVEITTCTAQRAGIGYYTEHLVDALLATRAPGDEVVLIGNRKLGLDITEKWGARLRIGGAPVRYLWMQADASRLLREVGADFAVFPNYLAPLVSPCPYLNIVHDLALVRTPEFFNLRKRLLVQALLPIVAQAAAGVGTVSEASRRDVVAMLSVPEHRIVMLPGAPHPTCRPSSDLDVARVRRRYHLGRPYVLSVGTLEPRKNLPMLLEAFDRLLARAGTRSAELDLVTVGGRGWRDQHLRAELERRLPSGRVHAIGYVPEEDLVALYGGAEVLAYPSHFEGFGLPALEAMACGTPVVASDILALREVTAGAAVLVPPGDESALADRIAALVEDPALRAAARQRGLARASFFRWENSAATLWAFARAHQRKRPSIVTTIPSSSSSSSSSPSRSPSGPPAAPLFSSALTSNGVIAESHVAPAGAPPVGSDEADWAILATVAYADLFDAAVSVDELARTCLGARMSSSEVRRRATTSPLADLLFLDPAAGAITMRGREELIARGAEGVRRTAELLHKHRRVISALATLPFIRMLALSGGTAHKNARGSDDIDLFVVAAAGHVYTAYTMLFLISRMTRTRGIVCPNYLVDEDHLEIAYHHDLFTAHQAISMVPIAGLEVFQRFARANQAWIRRLYPGYQPRVAESALGRPRVQAALERSVDLAGDRLEALLRVIWRLHLGRRGTRRPGSDMVLGGGILKLHLSDHRRRVLARFEKRLEALRGEWDGRAATTAPALRSAPG
jgi:glycosyltransferase involved in cell wall biosynthesis